MNLLLRRRRSKSTIIDIDDLKTGYPFQHSGVVALPHSGCQTILRRTDYSQVDRLLSI